MTTVICRMLALPVHTRFSSCRWKSLWSRPPSALRSFPVHTAHCPFPPASGTTANRLSHTPTPSYQTQLPLTSPLHSAHISLNCYFHGHISKLRHTTISQIFLIKVLQSRSRHPTSRLMYALFAKDAERGSTIRLITHRGNKETSREPKSSMCVDSEAGGYFTQNNAIHSGGKSTPCQRNAPASIIITAM